MSRPSNFRQSWRSGGSDRTWDHLVASRALVVSGTALDRGVEAFERVDRTRGSLEAPMKPGRRRGNAMDQRGTACSRDISGSYSSRTPDLEATHVALRRTLLFDTGPAPGEGPMTEAEIEGLGAAFAVQCFNFCRVGSSVRFQPALKPESVFLCRGGWTSRSIRRPPN